MKRLYYLLLANVLMTLSACVSTHSIQEYSVYSRATIEQTRPVAKDFHQSCLRSNSYKPYSEYSKCSAEQEATDGIVKVASVLDAYSTALAALASDKLTDYKPDIDNLSTQIKKINGLDNAKIDAVAKLATLVANYATSGYQQNKIRQFMTQADASVLKVSEILADVISTNYATAIRYEISAWESAYKSLEKSARLSDDIHTRLAWEHYSKTQWKQRAELDARLAATNTLAEQLKNIGTTHHQLAQDAEKLESKEAQAIINSFITSVKPVIADMQAAFSEK